LLCWTGIVVVVAGVPAAFTMIYPIRVRVSLPVVLVTVSETV
jgi:hypothetical protein